MSQGIIIFAIVLCLSLLARLLISQLFSHRVFNKESSSPLQRGIIPPPPPAEVENSNELIDSESDKNYNQVETERWKTESDANIENNIYSDRWKEDMSKENIQ